MENQIKRRVSNKKDVTSIFDSVELQEVPETELASLEDHLSENVCKDVENETITEENRSEMALVQIMSEDSLKDFRAVLFPEGCDVELKEDDENPSASTVYSRGMEILEEACHEANGNMVTNSDMHKSSPQSSSCEMSRLESGEASNDGNPVIPCPLCNLSFPSENYLEKHQFRFHKDEYLRLKDAVCASDEDPGSQQSKKSKHSKKLASVPEPEQPKPFKCSLCVKRFLTTDHLKHHMRIHTGDRPFKCTICEKAFIQAGNLHAHMRIHTNERPFKCNICGKTFNQSGNMHTHMGIHMDKKMFQCPTCEKCFSQNGSLRNHMKIHTGERPHICSVCSKAFLRKSHLDAHSRTHTGEKPFICSFCGRGFTQTGDLQSHMRLHTGDLPYKCKECGKGYSSSGHLNKHMRCHSLERPFECSVCDKAFNAKSTLISHMRLHTGERPYGCSVCGRHFYNSSNLRKHMRVHDGKKSLSSATLLDPVEAATDESPVSQS